MKEKRFFLSAALMLFFGLVILFLYDKSISYEEDETRKKQMDALLLTLHNKIEETTKVSLTSSVILAKSPYVIDCLSRQDRNICLHYLLDIRNTMALANVFENARLHLHTKDFKSFMRLWDYSNQTNDDLSTFRHALDKIKQTKHPIKGIEIGRSGMFMRAIAPVFQKGEYVGTIETVVDFKDLNTYFKKDGVEFYVLMKNEYRTIANAVAYNDKLMLDNYTIVNQEINGLNFIKEVNFQGTGFLKRGDNYVLYTPIVDINGEHIGFFVLTWSESLSLASFK
ncbi:cache domain-containing protein [Sulfurospirillum oryzae]|uniref:cache domain-containing protein n=1 Tax=Sulfurospirillum oryzae TaxID=2976535 RepID=UPI0021E846F4|nr:cache domain-containing protein [Sulfurospirillum oryzae]